MFVGIDVHKDTHTAVGISPFGEKLFEITVGNYTKDFETLDLKVKEMSGVLSPYIGLEDVRGYGEHYLDDAEIQNNLQKCLTFSHSGSLINKFNYSIIFFA